MKKVVFSSRNEMLDKKMGLVIGRHQIPVNDYIFDEEGFDVFDFNYMKDKVHEKLYDTKSLELYVTGLTVALVEVINYCVYNDIDLTLYHFNRDTNEYIPQEVTIFNKDSYYRGADGKFPRKKGEN